MADTEVVGVKWRSDSREAQQDAEKVAAAFSKVGAAAKHEAGVASSALDSLGRNAAENARKQVGATLKTQESLKAQVFAYKQVASEAERGSRTQVVAAGLAEKAQAKLSRTVGAGHRDLQGLGKRARDSSRDLGQLTRGALLGSGAFRGLGRSVAYASGLFLAGGGIVLGVRSLIREFTESTKVGAQVRAVIQSTGGAARVTAKDVDKLAEAELRKTGIDDEAVKSAEAMLLTFTNVQNRVGAGNDVFNQATKAVLDMDAAITGGASTAESLRATSIRVGKALNDPIKGMTALRRVGVQFTKDQEAQIKALVASGRSMDAQKLILHELNREFGGSAEAAGKELPGQLSILRESLKNTGADALRIFVPALRGIVSFANKELLPALDDVSGFVGDVFKERTFTGKVKVAASGLRDLGEGVANRIKSAIDDVDWKAVGGQVSRTLESGITFSVGAAAGLLSSLAGAIVRSKDEILDIADRIVTTLGEAIVANRGKLANVGAQLLVATLSTLTDPLFWAHHWDLALAVAVNVFPVGRIAGLGGRLGLALLAPLERIAPRLAGVILEGLSRLPGLVGRVLDRIPGLIRSAFRLSAIAAFVQGVRELFANLFTWLKRAALYAALGVVEPFSHLPGRFGGWARRAKEALHEQLQAMERDAAGSGQRIGDKLGRAMTAAARTWLNTIVKDLQLLENYRQTAQSAGEAASESPQRQERRAPRSATPRVTSRVPPPHYEPPPDDTTTTTSSGGGAGSGSGGGGGTTPSRPKGPTPAQRKQTAIVHEAYRYGPGSGITYVTGGVSPQTGFDCSGYLWRLYKDHGVDIPRTSEAQWADPNAIKVAPGEEAPGDGVYFTGSSKYPPPGHCGIYVGGGRFIEYFRSGKPARVSNLADRGDYWGARRWLAVEKEPGGGGSHAPRSVAHQVTQERKERRERGRTTHAISQQVSPTLGRIHELVRQGIITPEVEANLRAQARRLRQLIARALRDGVVSKDEFAAIQRSWKTLAGALRKGIADARSAAVTIRDVRKLIRAALKDGMVSDEELNAITSRLGNAKDRIAKRMRELIATVAAAGPKMDDAWGRVKDVILNAFDERVVGRVGLNRAYGEKQLTRAQAVKAGERAQGTITSIESGGVSPVMVTIKAKAEALIAAYQAFTEAMRGATGGVNRSADTGAIDRAAAALVEARDQWDGLAGEWTDVETAYHDAYQRKVDAAATLADDALDQYQEAQETKAKLARKVVEKDLNKVYAQLRAGKITLQQAEQQINQILAPFGLSLADLGNVLDTSELETALGDLKSAVEDLTAAIKRLDAISGGATPAAGTQPSPSARAAHGTGPVGDDGPLSSSFKTRIGANVPTAIVPKPTPTATPTIDTGRLAVGPGGPVTYDQRSTSSVTVAPGAYSVNVNVTLPPGVIHGNPQEIAAALHGPIMDEINDYVRCGNEFPKYITGQSTYAKIDVTNRLASDVGQVRGDVAAIKARLGI